MRSQHIQSVSFDTVPLFTKMGNSKHSDAAGIASVAGILIFLVAISVFSVARLLTFIAAICALLYVRYTTLRIANDEFDSTFQSVCATLEETSRLMDAHFIPDARSSKAQDSDHFAVHILQLYIIEVDILAYCVDVHCASDQNATTISNLRWKEMWDLITLHTLLPDRDADAYPPSIRDDVVEKVKEIQEDRKQRGAAPGMLDRWIGMLSQPPLEDCYRQARDWEIFIFTLGFSRGPFTARWYGVRDDVLCQMRRRELLRSVISVDQISQAAE